MGLPDPNNPIWSDIISGKREFQFDFLAVKIFLGSAQVTYKKNPGALPRLALDLYRVFEKNKNLPSAQKDLKKIRIEEAAK